MVRPLEAEEAEEETGAESDGRADDCTGERCASSGDAAASSTPEDPLQSGEAEEAEGRGAVVMSPRGGGGEEGGAGAPGTTGKAEPGGGAGGASPVALCGGENCASPSTTRPAGRDAAAGTPREGRVDQKREGWATRADGSLWVGSDIQAVAGSSCGPCDGPTKRGPMAVGASTGRSGAADAEYEDALQVALKLSMGSDDKQAVAGSSYDGCNGRKAGRPMAVGASGRSGAADAEYENELQVALKLSLANAGS
eukprot:1183830-Prorocentrum_minimum.AAC.1